MHTQIPYPPVWAPNEDYLHQAPPLIYPIPIWQPNEVRIGEFEVGILNKVKNGPKWKYLPIQEFLSTITFPIRNQHDLSIFEQFSENQVADFTRVIFDQLEITLKTAPIFIYNLGEPAKKMLKIETEANKKYPKFRKNFLNSQFITGDLYADLYRRSLKERNDILRIWNGMRSFQNFSKGIFVSTDILTNHGITQCSFHGHEYTVKIYPLILLHRKRNMTPIYNRWRKAGISINGKNYVARWKIDI